MLALTALLTAEAATIDISNKNTTSIKNSITSRSSTSTNKGAEAIKTGSSSVKVNIDTRVDGKQAEQQVVIEQNGKKETITTDKPFKLNRDGLEIDLKVESRSRQSKPAGLDVNQDVDQQDVDQPEVAAPDVPREDAPANQESAADSAGSNILLAFFSQIVLSLKNILLGLFS